MAKTVVSVLLVAAAVVGLAYCACDAERDGNIVCRREFKPVCATFKKTFDNGCELIKNRCMLASQGYELVESEGGDCCERQCRRNFDPVCGCNGTQFSNECELRRDACKNRDCVPLDPKGSCQVSPLTPTPTPRRRLPFEIFFRRFFQG